MAHALREGLRGHGGGQTLAQLLAQERGVRSKADLPRFTVRRMIAWAQEHHRRTGRWPASQSRPLPGTRRETWAAVAMALSQGRRGLPGGSSLSRVLKGRPRRDRH